MRRQLPATAKLWPPLTCLLARTSVIPCTKTVAISHGYSYNSVAFEFCGPMHFAVSPLSSVTCLQHSCEFQRNFED